MTYSDNNQYLVGVRCYTFNQSCYITDTMNGFVMQQTDFPFVCCVVDDASADGEQEVIKRYVSENFDLQDYSVAFEKDADYGHVLFAQHKTNRNCYFAVVLLKENHYSQKKSKASYLREWMDAKYIALCEGDDYWTNPLKLQKQVDYLENHPDCSMSTHAAFFDVKGEWMKWGCQHEMECDLTTDEVIRNGGLYLATASLIYRRVLSHDKPEWRKMADVGDYPLQILGTLRGTLHYFPEIMCVYRYQHPESWTNNEKLAGINVSHLKREIVWLKLLDEETDNKYSDAVYSHLISFYSVLYRNKQTSFNDYYKAFQIISEHSYKRLFRDVLIRNFYGLYRMYKKVTACKNS